jgi:hypothetical protein
MAGRPTNQGNSFQSKGVNCTCTTLNLGQLNQQTGGSHPSNTGGTQVNAASVGGITNGATVQAGQGNFSSGQTMQYNGFAAKSVTGGSFLVLDQANGQAQRPGQQGSQGTGFQPAW